MLQRSIVFITNHQGRSLRNMKLSTKEFTMVERRTVNSGKTERTL